MFTKTVIAFSQILHLLIHQKLKPNWDLNI